MRALSSTCWEQYSCRPTLCSRASFQSAIVQPPYLCHLVERSAAWLTTGSRYKPPSRRRRSAEGGGFFSTAWHTGAKSLTHRPVSKINVNVFILVKCLCTFTCFVYYLSRGTLYFNDLLWLIFCPCLGKTGVEGWIFPPQRTLTEHGHLSGRWSAPNSRTRRENQNRCWSTSLHIHWPSCGCWLKVSGAALLMSIADRKSVV